MTSSEPPIWKVDHFQINGSHDGEGEAAIYLLVDSNEKSRLRVDQKNWSVRGEVRAAVLMDAGQGSSMLENLRQTMQQIEREYGNVGPLLQFDAVIMTHWHEDHYRQFCHYDDCLIKHGTRYGYSATDKKIACFKYNGTTPLTRLYCQCWNTTKAKGRGAAQAPKGLDWPETGRGQSYLVAPDQNTFSDAEKEFNLLYRMRPHINKDKRSDPLPEPVAKCIASAQLAIGVNVFTGKYRTKTPEKTWDQLTNLETLMDENDPSKGPDSKDWVGAPGMYIVGSQGKLVGGYDINKKGISILVIDEQPTKRTPNDNSLISIIAWPAVGSSPRRISIYANGDSEFQNDECMVKWLKASKEKLRFDVLKVGHHGSRRGTSVSLIKQTNPVYYLMSPGYQFAHPTHYLLTWLDAWFRTTDGNLPIRQRIHALCYPYYLGKTYDDKDSVRYTRAGDKANDIQRYIEERIQKIKSKPDREASQAYLDSLKALFKSVYAGSTSSDPLARILQADKDTVAEPSAEAVQKLKEVKDQIAAIQADTSLEQRQKRNKTSGLKPELDKAEKMVKDSTAEDAIIKPFAALAPHIENIWSTRNGIVDYRYYPFKLSTDQDIMESVMDQTELKELRNMRIRYTNQRWPWSPMGDFEYRLTDNSVVRLPDSYKRYGGPRKKVVTNTLFSVMVGAENQDTTARKRRNEAPTPRQCDAVLDSKSEAALIAAQLEEPPDEETESAAPSPTPVNILMAEHEPDQPPIRPQILLTSSVRSSVKSIVPSDSLLAGDSLKVAASDVAFDDFVAALVEGKVVLDAATDTSTNWSALVSPHSDLSMWFDQLLPSVEGKGLTKVTLHGSNDEKFLQSVEVELAPEPGKHLNFKSDNETLRTAFNVEQSIAEKMVNNTGMLLYGPGVVCGLGSITGALTTQDICNILDVPLPPFVNSKCLMTQDSSDVNGLWFYPTLEYQTTLRLAIVSTPVSNESPFLLDFLPFKYCEFVGLKLSGRRTWRQTVECQGPATTGGEGSRDPNSNRGDTYAMSQSEICSSTLIQLKDATKTLSTRCHAYLQCSYETTPDDTSTRRLNEVVIDLRPLTDDANGQHVGAGQVIHDVLGWIGAETGITAFFGGQSGTDNDSGTNTRSWLQNITDDFEIREFRLVIDRAADNAKWNFSLISLTLEARVDWGVVPSNTTRQVPLQLLFSRSSSGNTSSFSVAGGLWPHTSASKAALQRLNPGASLIPPLQSSTKNPQYFMSLPHLFSRGSHTAQLPNEIHPDSQVPTRLTLLRITLGSDVVSIKATVGASPGVKRTGPRLSMTGARTFIQYDVQKKTFEFDFDATVVLRPSISDSALGDASAFVELSTRRTSSSTGFQSEFVLENITFAHLDQFFHVDDRDAVMGMMRLIKIPLLEVEYRYGGGDVGVNFDITGTVIIDTFELHLSYSYGKTASVPGAWLLTASAAFDETHHTALRPRTIGSLLSGISPSLAQDLPAFLADISLNIAGSSKISLDCAKHSSSAGTNFVVFSLGVTIGDKDNGDLSFTYLQISESGTGIFPLTKRLFRVTYADLPSLSIPTLPEFRAPFGAMELVWVSHDILRSEIEAVDSALQALHQLPLAWKDPRGATTDANLLDAKSPGNDTILAQGCHLIITDEQTVSATAIVDFVFGKKTQAAGNGNAGGASNASNPASSDPSAAEVTPTVSTDAGTGTLNKQVGNSLSISGISLTFDEATSKIQITFDARIKLGPLAGSLEGFGVRFPVSKFQAKLKEFDLEGFELLIAGAGLEFTQKPISVAGLLHHKKTATLDEYMGGLAIEVDPYAFLAGGYYGKVTNPITNKTFESIFVFAKLDGPFVELELGELSGLTAGFGYHSDIRLPKVQEVTQFPFLKDETNGSDALQILQSLVKPTSGLPWFRPSDGPLWFAAGLTAKLVQAFTIGAVLVVDVKPDDVIIGIFAECKASFPLDAKGNTDAILAQVDLGISASVDFAKGTLIVQGELTDASFLLSKQCKLRGGFALCYWFEGSGHNGDWFFSLGGFHPQFKVPTHYPPAPSRVGIEWHYDDSISIYGGAYFAVTPKCAMAGLVVDMVYHSGRLFASLHAFADLLLNFNPLYFMADVGIHVKASVTLGWGWFSHTFHVDMDAELHLHGPPVAGVVHVDWTIFAFDVHFGNEDSSVPPALSWPGFKAMIQQRKEDEAEKSMLDIKTTQGLQSSTGDQGDIHTTEAATWSIDSLKLALSVTSMFPIQKFKLNNGDVQSVGDAYKDIYMQPMHVANGVSSTLEITIQHTTANPPKYLRMRHDIGMKNLPSAIWGKYEGVTTPALTSDPLQSIINSILAGATSNPNTNPSLLSSENAARPLVVALNLSLPQPDSVGPELPVNTSLYHHDCYEGSPPSSTNLSRLTSWMREDPHQWMLESKVDPVFYPDPRAAQDQNPRTEAEISATFDRIDEGHARTCLQRMLEIGGYMGGKQSVFDVGELQGDGIRCKPSRISEEFFDTRMVGKDWNQA